MPLYHYSRLSDASKANIYEAVTAIQFSYSRHAWEQKHSKRVKNWEHIVENGTIIELNYDAKGGRHKVLLRTPDGHCAVFGLKSQQVVTMWWNDPNDTHKTLDASHYDGGVDWKRM